MRPIITFGGLITVPGCGPVVIDFTGLDLSLPQVGILADHDATLKGIVGHVGNDKLIVAASHSSPNA